MVTETRKMEIKAETHALLEGFAKVLDKLPARKTTFKDQRLGTRAEGASVLADSEFRVRMFANASKKDADSIIAEKGVWTQ